MKLVIKKGSTSQTIHIFIQDSSSTTGAGKTGLAFNSSGLAAYYVRPRSAPVAITLATQTVTGAFSSGGFVELDSTNMPGWYRLDLPDAALATGVNWVGVHLRGASGMAPVPLEIQLVDYDPNDSVRLGLSALPSGAMMVKKNQTLSNFVFYLVSSTDHVTPKTGATVTATRSIDGGAFGSCANSVTEIANGFYKIDLAAGDLNGNTIALRFTASGADDAPYTIITQP